MPFLIIVSLVVSLVVLAVVLYKVTNRIQREKFAAWAAQNNYTFFERVPKEELDGFLEPLRTFHPFSETPPQLTKWSNTTRTIRGVTNLLQGAAGEVEVTVFNLSIKDVSKSGGKSSVNYRSLGVLLFQTSKLSLPKFAMSMEAFPIRFMQQFMDIKDIDFEGYPDFSSKYLLQGEDEEAIREAFTDEVIEFFEKHQAYRQKTIEGEGQTLLIYANRTNMPERIDEEIESGVEIVRLMSR